MLIGALICSYYLQVKKIRAIHETVVSIFAGEAILTRFMLRATDKLRDGNRRNGRWTHNSAISRTSDSGNAGQCYAGPVWGSELIAVHLLEQSFKHTLFFNLLLPPIILNSGYELKQVRTARSLHHIDFPLLID